jgi:CubicO group peptidase (beta-lactamase class C family)
MTLATRPPADEALPRAERPADLGFSPERLARIGAAFRQDVERGAIPGAVVLIARHGKLAFVEAFGFRDREAGAPMTVDAIFRIASMTKPVASVAAMMLVEEGRLQIAHPVSHYLPEFEELKVGVETGGTLTLEDARREMTVQDLMRHSSGLTYGQFGDTAVKKAYREADAMNFGQTNAELVSKLARIPLAYQPGTVWEYGMSTDVLGRVIEVVSGLDLDRFVAERITGPLGLRDTGFHARDLGRLAEPQVNPATGQRPPMFDVTRRPNWISAGGGMVSTASDYARFAQMLIDGGELGARLLSPATVSWMTSDHLPPGIGFGPFTPLVFGAVAPTPEFGYGFGLGFGVRKEPGRSPLPGSVGDFYWSGVTGTYFWCDPREKLLAVLMMQSPENRLHYRALLRQLVYQALVERAADGAPRA